MQKNKDTLKLYKLSDKQKEFISTIDESDFSLLVGQGRSGKTLAIVYYIFKRAIKYPNTNHCIFRNTLASAVDGVWKISIKEVLTHFFPALPLFDNFKINETNHEITFHNGSRILIKGLDDTERAQKILSTQWATIFIDESHLVNYTYFGLLLTRLPQPKDVDYKVKFIMAANWCPKSHWLKSFFIDGINPESKSPHNLSTKYITSTTSDNPYIDADNYINNLKNAGDRKSRLMCAGSDFYDVVDGALWLQDDILKTSCPDNLTDIVLAFDPAVSNSKTSDEHGITIAGKKDGMYYILLSYEVKKDINDIAKEVCHLYHLYNCSVLVFEGNNGGQWISNLISQYDKKIFIKEVRAKVGKLLRASPIAALYKNKLVYHCDNFQQTEDQMLTFTGKQDSPNALDSLVYALKYLSENDSYVNPNDI